jgi:hypothetical protein
MLPKHRLRWILAAATVASLSLGAGSCAWKGSPFLLFRAPRPHQLSLPGSIEVVLQIGMLVDRDTLVVELDGEPIDPDSLQPAEGGPPWPFTDLLTTLVDVPEGSHVLTARAEFRVPRPPVDALVRFDVADLDRPDECEILNDAHCFLPFPSSRFLEEVGDETRTGLRTNYPDTFIRGLEDPPNLPLLAGPYNVYDGYAPTAQVLVHLEGVDPEASGASRLLPGVPQSPPYVGVRTHDLRSLDADSPTVLLDVDTGERVLHWVEVDANPRALADPSRQVLFLRPARSLVPDHRYIVAFRGMRDADGNLLEPELPFRALRDRRHSTIPALEARRDHFEDIFAELRRAGVPRRDLQLVFDFHTRSREQLHERMLFMRDDALGWLAGLAPDDVSYFQDVEIAQQGDCDDPDEQVWRWVRGRFTGPYYMDGDIDVPTQPVFLATDANGMPVRAPDGTGTPLLWDVAVPCSVFRGEQVGHPLLLGHGFLGDGRGMVQGFVEGGVLGDPSDGDVGFIAGATDWRGLSSTGNDALAILFNVIGSPARGHQFNNFRSLPERLMQGMVNTLVLSRMMKSGFFNRLPEFQRTPGDPSTGVFGVDEEMFYFGVSLGGIQGTLYAALNQDAIRHNIDVPAMNFPLLEQRSTQFPLFLALIEALGLSDPMELDVILQLQHEIWVDAEAAGYVRHITGDVEPPLPDTPAKKLLMTVAFMDLQVSNQASEIMARSLGIPNLVGSIQEQLPAIPDADAGAEGLDSALVIYDVGDLDPFDPAYEPFRPPLANRIVEDNKCDPHGLPRLSIPASIEQLRAFLRPGGRIFNFCTGAGGICDAAEPSEQPAEPCDVFAP